MPIVGSYKTIAEHSRTEIKIRGSRFIATAVSVDSKETAAAELSKIQKEFWDATHNCYAYRLAPDGLQYRFADDGEPSGSAGKPILFVLQQRELVDCLVVVTRYFGGTKLGVGGLVRAYSEAAVAALDQARILVCHATDAVRIFATYDDMRAVRQLVERYAIRMEEEFEDVVRYTVDLRSDQVEEFAKLLTEISQGRAGMVNLDQIDRA